MSNEYAQIIRASAGSGKTRELSNRFIRLLVMGEKPERILATTFTKKAAGEIFERVYTRLASAVLDCDLCCELGSEIGRPAISMVEVGEVFQRLVRSQHRVSICTLDSLFAKIARSFALELGLSSDWRIGESWEVRNLQGQAVQRILCGGSCLGLNIGLNIGSYGESYVEEKEASSDMSSLLGLLEHGRTKASVVALLLKRLSELYGYFREANTGAGSDADLSLGVWVWEKSDGVDLTEICELVDALRVVDLPLTKQGKPNSNYVKVRDRILGYLSAYRWDKFLEETIVDNAIYGDGMFSTKEIPLGFIDVIQRAMVQIRAEYGKRLYQEGFALYKLLSNYSASYEAEVTRLGVLNFDDIKYRLLNKPQNCDLESLYYRLDRRYAHLLLDEFQDTSSVENSVLQPVVDEVLSKVGVENTFFCVGDVKQAIYGWRGGVAEIFEALEEDYPILLCDGGENARNKSYRCAPAIVDVVNMVFTNIVGNEALSKYREDGQMSSPVEEWQDRFSPHTCANVKHRGYVEFRSVCAGSDGDTQKDLNVEDLSVEDSVADLVRGLLEKNPQMSIGIITRSNKCGDDVVKALSAIGVRVSGEGGVTIVDSPIVAVMLAMFRVIDHPGDSLSAYHVANSPLGEVVGLLEWDNRRIVDKIASDMRRKILVEGYSGCIRGWMRALHSKLSPAENLRLEQLCALALQFRGLGSRSVDFVEYVSYQSVEDPSSSSVRVMTIHKSKGLEFDVVVLPELDGIFNSIAKHSVLVSRKTPRDPPSRVVLNRKESVRRLFPEMVKIAKENEGAIVKEALSVLYVALTRARSALYMFTSDDEGKPNTYSGILRAGLSGGAECSSASKSCVDERVIFSCGDATCLDELSRRESPIERVRNTIRLSGAQKRLRGSFHRSPSCLENGGVLNMSELFSIKAERKRRIGTALHLLFSDIEWLDDKPFDRALLEQRVATVCVSNQEVQEVVDRFLGAVREPSIRAQLSSDMSDIKVCGRTTSVMREFPFVVEKDGVVFHGRIDRLVVERDNEAITRILIIDYKTDSAKGDQAKKELVDRYNPQMQLYKVGAAALFKVDEGLVDCELCFIG